MMKINKILALMLAFIPPSPIKNAAYRKLLGAKIGRGCSIGLGTVINVRVFECGDGVYIGNRNKFEGDMRVVIGSKSRIIGGNRFITRANHDNPNAKFGADESAILIGEHCLINAEHFLDGTGTIEMGDNSWLAGMGTQIWTHGLQVTDRHVKIGAGAYVGSAARLAPGAEIPAGAIVALGAVVASKFTQPDSIIGGVPAKLVRSLTAEERQGYVKSFSYW